MAVFLKVEGLREYSVALRAFREQGMPAQLRLTNLSAAELVARTARPRSPVGSGRDPHPGRLRDSVRAVAGQRAASVKAGGARAPYAAAIHWGWRKHHIKPNPFIWKTAEELYASGAIAFTYRREIDRLLRTISAI